MLEDIVVLTVGFALGTLLRDVTMIGLRIVSVRRYKASMARARGSAEQMLADLERQVAEEDQR